MIDQLKAVHTRFRAYQLGNAGASFSYFADGRFTLIEGRLTETNHRTLRNELEQCGKSEIDTLHITSWDQDHCSHGDLGWILDTLQPKTIEYPGYAPHSDTSKTCLSVILKYQADRARAKVATTLRRIDPQYIAGLETAKGLGYSHMFYHPKTIYEGSNDNSTVKLFRSGMFNVASLGDVEHPTIGAYLRACPIFKREIDVLILAHHGSAHSITSKKFLQEVKPSVAICSSNYDNQFDHPAEEVRDLLYEQGIPIFTTKTGDVVIESIAPHRSHFRVINLKADSEAISSVQTFVSRKSRLLSMNADTIRDRYALHNRPRL